MNENKFLKNLNQKSTSSQSATELPSAGQAERDVTADPIQRLTQALTRHSQAMEGLSSRLDRLEQRPQPATKAEVAALVKEAQAGVSFTLDSKAVAQLVTPELVKGLPTPAGLKEAADQAASLLTQAGQEAARRMEGATQGKVDRWATTLGFLNWRNALFGGFLPLVLMGLSLYQLGLSRTQAETSQGQLSQVQSERQAWIAFGKWVRINFPAQWKTYTNPAYRPADAYLKKVKPKS
jgi:hypothetical protein